MIARPYRCWAWGTIEDVLRDGPASVSLITHALFDGDTCLANRKLVARMLHELTVPGRKYRGGPYVMRVRDGYYALPDPDFVPAQERFRTALCYHVRTFEELEEISGASTQVVVRWLRLLRESGELREEYAPSDYARETGKVRIKVYWIKATRAAQRWSELKSQRRIRAKRRPAPRRRKKESGSADTASRGDGPDDGRGPVDAACLVPEFVLGDLGLDWVFGRR